MFDRDGTWFVIYTEDGPMDITLFDLTSNVSKELCDVCNGAGEDRYEQRCRFCRGKGVKL